MTSAQRTSIIAEIHVVGGLIIAFCVDGKGAWFGVGLTLWGVISSLAAIKGMRDEGTDGAS